MEGEEGIKGGSATVLNPPPVLVGTDAAYSYLRKLIGALAFAFPIVVVAGGQLTDEGSAWRGSISSYYYSATRNLFVGILCALAIFFFSYEYPSRAGYRNDRRLSIAAGFMAIGVALFPTARQGAAAEGWSNVAAKIHIGSAMTLFVILGTLSLWFFTKSDRVDPPATRRENLQMLGWTPRRIRDPLPLHKRRRNFVYRACGRTIFGSIVVMLLVNLFDVEGEWFLVFECLAVLAFALSWLVKGDALPWFRDPPEASG